MSAACRRARVRHHQAVWETATFEVDVPADVEDVQAWVEENFDVLFGEAATDLHTEVGDAVEGVDSEIEVEELSRAKERRPAKASAEEKTWFRNYYRCDRCGHQWTDEWSCQCDDDCPECGARHFTPYRSDDLSEAA